MLNLHLPVNLYTALLQSSFLCSSLLQTLSFFTLIVFCVQNKGLVALSLPSWKDAPEQGSGSVFFWLGVANGGCTIPAGLPADLLVSPCLIQSETPRLRRSVVERIKVGMDWFGRGLSQALNAVTLAMRPVLGRCDGQLFFLFFLLMVSRDAAFRAQPLTLGM